MGGDWPTTTFGDICSHSAFGPRFSSKEYSDKGNIACLRTKDISADGRIEFSTMPMAELDEKSFFNHFLQREDLVITRTGRVGTTAVFTEFDQPVVPGAFLIRFRLDRNLAYPRFYRYFFNSSSGQALIQTVATGSVQQNLNITNLHTLSIPLPPLATQKKIAHILGSLDDKIELNRQMNATLEAMAQALFKSWFVDFDPVIDNALATGNPIPDELQARAEVRVALGDKRKPLPEAIQKQFPSSFVFSEEMGWIPEGWEETSFGKVIKPLKGKTITKKTVTSGDVPVVAGGLTPAYYHNMHNVEGPVVTVSASGANAGYVNLYHQRIWASDCSYIGSRQTSHVYSTYLFLKGRQYEITRMQQGAAQPHVYPKDLERLRFVKAPDSLRDELEARVRDSFKKIHVALNEADCLAELRDTLLPKLLSGQLRIPDVEKLVADAV